MLLNPMFICFKLFILVPLLLFFNVTYAER